MTTAAELFAAAEVILLDFDGPVTRLLPPPANTALTDRARALALALGMPLTPDLAATTDHLAIIRAANRHSAEVAMRVEALCTAEERVAAATSEPTAGVRETLEAAARQKSPVVIVTNNSPECATEFLASNQLSNLVEVVIGRDPRHIELMKPSPAMLLAAVAQRLGAAIMVGDSVSDITAAGAAGLPAIGLAKNDQRANELGQAGASAVIRSMRELTPST